MPSSIEDRLAHLEDVVQRLEEAAAVEQAAKAKARWARLALLGVLAAFYAWYLYGVTGTLTGL